MEKKKMRKLYIEEEIFDFLDVSITDLEELNKEFQEIGNNSFENIERMDPDYLKNLLIRLDRMSAVFTELGEKIFSNPLFKIPEKEIVENIITDKNDNALEEEEKDESELILNEIEADLNRLSKKFARILNLQKIHKKGETTSEIFKKIRNMIDKLKI